VGRITNSVNGITLPRRAPATSHQNVAPSETRRTDDSRPKAAQVCLHDSGSAVAGREIRLGYLDAPFHSGWMFDKVDIDGGSREQATGEDSNEPLYVWYRTVGTLDSAVDPA
jgi:hypothetical protein